MVISLFLFFVSFGMILFFFTIIARDQGLRTSLGWIVAALFICMAVLLATGEEITSTTVFDEETSVTTSLSYGISTSTVVIIFLLFGIVSITFTSLGYLVYPINLFLTVSILN